VTKKQIGRGRNEMRTEEGEKLSMAAIRVKRRGETNEMKMVDSVEKMETG